MRKVKKYDIIVLLDRPFEVIDQRVVRTIKMLQSARFSVCLICYKSQKFPTFEIFDDFDIHRILDPEIENSRSLISIRRKQAKLILDLFNFKAIWSNDHTMLDIGKKIKLRKNCFLIYDSHEFFQNYQLEFNNSESLIIKIKSKIWVQLQRKLEKSNTKFVDVFVSINESLVYEMKRIFNLSCPTFEVKNVPDHQMYSVGIELKEEIRIKLDTILSKFNLLYIGNYIREFNGLETVFYALQNNPDIHLILLGSSKSPDYFENLIKELKIENQVLIIERQATELIPEIASYCKAAVIPTMESGILQNYLSLPNKFFDSIKLSLPIICTNLPEQKKIIEKYKNGILTNPFDKIEASIEISNAIKKLRENYSYYKLGAEKANKAFKYENEYLPLIKHINDSFKKNAE